VYNDLPGINGKKPRIVLILPQQSATGSPNPNGTTTSSPAPGAGAANTNSPSGSASGGGGPGEILTDLYDLEMTNDAVQNQFVIAERPKDPLPTIGQTPAQAKALFNPRARNTVLTGRVKHECTVRPVETAAYRKKIRERTKAYNEPKRQLKMLDESAGRGAINRLSSGVGATNAASFKDLIVRFLPPLIIELYAEEICRDKNPRRAPSSAWLACRGTSSSTRCSGSSRRSLVCR
jgi:transcription initiation factor TFIIF subunit beta